MSEIWNSLRAEINTDIQESGMLRAVLNGIEFLGLNADAPATLRLGVSSSFALGVVKNDLMELIRSKLERSLQREAIVSIEGIAPQAQTSLLDQLCVDEPPASCDFELRSPYIEIKPKWFLNPDYKLVTFIDGAHSKFAVKSIELLSSSNQPQFRQLFLYGPSGNGKTHLLHALGWRFKENSNGINVKLFSADEFINDYHLHLSKKQMPEFRGKYRLKTDALLIDDIHCMSRAKGAQEELFNIFNYFEQTGKFIAFTSDKSPHQLEGFEPRLLTRFQGGLSCEITVPDLEDRINILELKQHKFGFMLSREVIRQVALSSTSSVRSLEGAMFKIGSYQRLMGVAVTTAELAKLLPEISKASEAGGPTVESILRNAAQSASVKISDLKSTSRRRNILIARAAAMQRMRDELSLSYVEIGRVFGKDHSTVINALKRN